MIAIESAIVKIIDAGAFEAQSLEGDNRFPAGYKADLHDRSARWNHYAKRGKLLKESLVMQDPLFDPGFHFLSFGPQHPLPDTPERAAQKQVFMLLGIRPDEIGHLLKRRCDSTTPLEPVEKFNSRDVEQPSLFQFRKQGKG